MCSSVNSGETPQLEVTRFVNRCFFGENVLKVARFDHKVKTNLTVVVTNKTGSVNSTNPLNSRKLYFFHGWISSH